MKLGKKILLALAVSSLAGATTAAAQAPSAAPAVRAGGDIQDANAMRGGWFIPLLAVIAVLLGILAIVDDGGDRPTSP